MSERTTNWICQECESQVTVETKSLTNLLPDRILLYCNCSLAVAEAIGRRNQLDKFNEMV